MKYLVHSISITSEIFSFSFCSCHFTWLDATNIILTLIHTFSTVKNISNGFGLTVTITYYVCTMNALASDIKSLTEVVWNSNSYWIFTGNKIPWKAVTLFPVLPLKEGSVLYRDGIARWQPVHENLLYQSH